MFPDVAHTGLPLSGLVVLDCTIWQQGTYSTAMLADFGADVIKIEGPDSADPGRGFNTPPGHPNGYWESHNRNKRGIVLDLKNPEGRETLLRLVETADVFVQNMRKGVMGRLGLSYADMKARNPGIIYASANAFGEHGPQAHWPGFDILGQARGGTTTMQGPPGMPPVFAFPGLADQVGAMFLSYGILVALWHRARTGEGQEVQGSLLSGQLALQSFNVTQILFGQKLPPRRSRLEADALWNSYPTSDGKYVAIAMPNGDHWFVRLCAALGCPDLAADERFARHDNRIQNRRELVPLFDAIFIEKDRDEWLRLLGDEGGFPISGVQDWLDAIDDPQVAANGYIHDYPHPHWGDLRIVGPGVQLGQTPGTIRSVAPEFGQHTEDVLLEHGFTWDEIAALRDAGAIGGR